jgi:hypothetical protein
MAQSGAASTAAATARTSPRNTIFPPLLAWPTGMTAISFMACVSIADTELCAALEM